MGWIIKDMYEDDYDFEVDRMNLESMDITAFSCPKLRIIEVPVADDDLETLQKVYELLFPGLFEDMERMLTQEGPDPYKVKYYYKMRQSGADRF
ncbi:hypothetical protein [Thiomicrospira sp. WB1]|jgi:hypothetical protein|uniref:hypothetical protein n=1 Tax=Thiomicrospira sp. WB1 TaxID=1685380 RepID=UPI0007499E2D|nr:hypothetical protein [Thiomicrospira sp. WB1]KUJ71362.1 hypothetical protein AVO41_07465 [Thiomicrospira sp. WB1]